MSACPGKTLATNLKHETAKNIKRHASLLMSCCQGDENGSSKTSNLSHHHHHYQQQQQRKQTTATMSNNNRPKTTTLTKTLAVNEKRHSFVVHTKESDGMGKVMPTVSDYLTLYSHQQQQQFYAYQNATNNMSSLKRNNYQAHKYVPPPPPGLTSGSVGAYHHYAKPSSTGCARIYDHPTTTAPTLYGFTRPPTSASAATVSTLGKTYRARSHYARPNLHNHHPRAPISTFSVSAHHNPAGPLLPPPPPPPPPHQQQMTNNQRAQRRRNSDQV